VYPFIFAGVRLRGEQMRKRKRREIANDEKNCVKKKSLLAHSWSVWEKKTTCPLSYHFIPLATSCCRFSGLP